MYVVYDEKTEDFVADPCYGQIIFDNYDEIKTGIRSYLESTEETYDLTTIQRDFTIYELSNPEHVCANFNLEFILY